MNETKSAPIIGLAIGILSLFFLPLILGTIAIIIGATNKEGTGKLGMLLGICTILYTGFQLLTLL